MAPCLRLLTQMSQPADVMLEMEALLPSDDEDEAGGGADDGERGFVTPTSRSRPKTQTTIPVPPPPSAVPSRPRGAQAPPQARAPVPAPAASAAAKQTRAAPLAGLCALSDADITPAPAPPPSAPVAAGAATSSATAVSASHGLVLGLFADAQQQSEATAAAGVFRGRRFALLVGGRSLGHVRARVLGGVLVRGGGAVVAPDSAPTHIVVGFTCVEALSQHLSTAHALSLAALLRVCNGGGSGGGGGVVLCDPVWVSGCVARGAVLPPPESLRLRPQHLETRRHTPRVADEAAAAAFFSAEVAGGGAVGVAAKRRRVSAEPAEFAAERVGGRRLPPKGAFACERPPPSPPSASAMGREGSGVGFLTAGHRTAAPVAAEGGSLNEHLISELVKLQQVYAKLGDAWRKYAYGKAVALVKKWRTPIRTRADVADVRGIGPKIADKIAEILESGTCKKMRYFEGNEEVAAITLFAKIWGVGPSTSQRLFRTHGLTTLDELRQRSARDDTLLNGQQRIGLRFFEELQQRIPRSEVDCLKGAIEAAVASVRRSVTMEICGSYRRGKETCGDVDVILCAPEGEGYDGVLRGVVLALKRAGVVTDDLTHAYMEGFAGASSGADESVHKGVVHRGDSHDSFMGVCRLPPCSDPETCPHVHLCEVVPGGSPTEHLHRRIDIKIYPFLQYPFALLYFTGSDYLNRSMRLYCHKRGLSLSDKGLFPVVRVAREVVHEGAPVQGCRTEKDVFDLLGLEYRPPSERNM